MMMIDTHCHLNDSRFASDLEAVLARAAEAGIGGMLTIACDPEDHEPAFALAAEHPQIAVAVGIHPVTAHRLGEGFPAALAALPATAARGALAIGECGLDYHWDGDPPVLQRQRCAAQLEVARRLDLPVILHVREAHADMLALLREQPDSRGIVHSFTAGPAEVETYLALGWHIAFNGVVTYPKAEEVRAAARLVPAERLLIETDAPYLAPVPRRGRRNEPAFARHTATLLAELRGDTMDALIAQTTANAQALFRWP